MSPEPASVVAARQLAEEALARRRAAAGRRLALSGRAVRLRAATTPSAPDDAAEPDLPDG
jgi:hypothetical protein